MKTIATILFVVVSAFLKAQDSTQIRDNSADTSSAVIQKSTPKPKAISPARESEKYKDEEQLLIRPDDLPLPVREALKDVKYNDWENSNIYQDRLSGNYSVEIIKGTTSKIYRFDKNGVVIEDPNKPKGKN